MTDLTPSDVEKFLAVWQAWGLSVDQWGQLATGSAQGGPNGDGLYPFTNRGGVTVLVPCLAKLASTVPTGQPFAFPVTCYADDELVRVRDEAGYLYAPAAMTITSFSLMGRVPDQSPAGTLGIQADVRVNGSSILSAPLRLLPGQRSSRAGGTAQPTITSPAVALNDLITLAVTFEGQDAQGLRWIIQGHWA